MMSIRIILDRIGQPDVELEFDVVPRKHEHIFYEGERFEVVQVQHHPDFIRLITSNVRSQSGSDT